VISSVKQLTINGLLFFTGCSSDVKKQQDQPIVQVGIEKLFLSEIKNELPHFMDKTDSIKAAQEYIDNWIKQRLLVSEAELKLSKEESDISFELEKYRQELLIYKYNWIHLDNLLKPLQIFIAYPDNFLKNQKIIEKKLGNNIHIIVIKQYYMSGDQAPIELIASQIRGAVFSRKKLDFLREIKDSLYLDALKYNKFKVFN
jgi:hypothetical protein